MIIAYYTENEKYLQKDDFRKDFKVNSLEELIDKIKVKDKVLIKASKKDIFDFKFNLPITDADIYEYEILKKKVETEPIFDYNSVEIDRKENVAYGVYSVNEKWHKILGKEIYFCQNNELLLCLVQEKDVCAFLYDDWEQLRNNLISEGEMGEILCAKMFCTKEQIEEMYR